MSRLIRALIVVLLIATLLPVEAASASSLSAKPQPPPTSTLTLTPPWTEPSLPANCELGRDSNGSQTMVCDPASVSGLPWSATLVIYAHGYVNPYFPAKQIPWDQVAVGGSKIYDQVTSMGYYFATTSYRANGLVVQDAIQDLLLVRQMAVSHIRDENRFLLLGVNVILAGVSEGGLITTLSIERYPGSYKGGMAACGPIGDFQKQVSYWGDFRALYDVYYPDLRQSYGGSAIKISNELIKAWYGDGHASALADTEVSLVLADQGRTLDLLRVANNAPYDTANPSSIGETVRGLLDYNIISTMNGQSIVGGNPYDNRSTIYASTVLFPTLNTLVSRYTASRTALRNIPKYQTTGSLTVPLVVLHTKGDPIVPYWHATLYEQKVSASGKFKLDTVERYGHCAFTMDEVVGAFNDLGTMITSGSLTTAKTQLTPSQYDAYVAQLQREGRLK